MSLSLSVCLNLRISVSLLSDWSSVFLFGDNKIIDHICVQYMRPCAMVSDTLRNSIICLSVQLSTGILRFFLYSIFLILEMIMITITITSVRVHRRDSYIPTLGSEGPQWYPVKLLRLSIYLSDALSIGLFA